MVTQNHKTKNKAKQNKPIKRDYLDEQSGIPYSEKRTHLDVQSICNSLQNAIINKYGQ